MGKLMLLADALCVLMCSVQELCTMPLAAILDKHFLIYNSQEGVSLWPHTYCVWVGPAQEAQPRKEQQPRGVTGALMGVSNSAQVMALMA